MSRLLSGLFSKRKSGKIETFKSAQQVLDKVGKWLKKMNEHEDIKTPAYELIIEYNNLIWMKIIMSSSNNLYSYVSLHNNRFTLLSTLEPKEQLPTLDDSDELMTIGVNRKLTYQTLQRITNYTLICSLIMACTLKKLWY